MANYRGVAFCSGCSVFMFGNLNSATRICSVLCSGKVVDKLWKSLRESMWGMCGKVSTSLAICSGYVIKLLKSGGNCGKSGKVYTGFYTDGSSLLNRWFYTVSTEPITIITNYLLERRS